MLRTEPITVNCNVWNEVNSLALEAFPPGEYLPPEKLVEMAEGGNYHFLALFDEDRFIGFMLILLYGSMSYLFFLAIAPEYRSGGYGSRALALLSELYPERKQVVDFEMLDAAAPNYEQRKKRREFYLRNGYKETGLFLSYFGGDFEVFCMNGELEPDEFKAMMKTVPVEGFFPTYFTR